MTKNLEKRFNKILKEIKEKKELLIRSEENEDIILEELNELITLKRKKNKALKIKTHNYQKDDLEDLVDEIEDLDGQIGEKHKYLKVNRDIRKKVNIEISELFVILANIIQDLEYPEDKIQEILKLQNDRFKRITKTNIISLKSGIFRKRTFLIQKEKDQKYYKDVLEELEQEGIEIEMKLKEFLKKNDINYGKRYDSITLSHFIENNKADTLNLILDHIETVQEAFEELYYDLIELKNKGIKINRGLKEFFKKEDIDYEREYDSITLNHFIENNKADTFDLLFDHIETVQEAFRELYNDIIEIKSDDINLSYAEFKTSKMVEKGKLTKSNEKLITNQEIRNIDKIWLSLTKDEKIEFVEYFGFRIKDDFDAFNKSIKKKEINLGDHLKNIQELASLLYELKVEIIDRKIQIKNLEKFWNEINSSYRKNFLKFIGKYKRINHRTLIFEWKEIPLSIQKRLIKNIIRFKTLLIKYRI